MPRMTMPWSRTDGPVGTLSVVVSWTCHREVLTGSRQLADLDCLRAFRPSVLEEANATLRMWYSGHDGSTARILEAVQHPGQPWERLGISIDAGSCGES